MSATLAFYKENPLVTDEELVMRKAEFFFMHEPDALDEHHKVYFV